MKKDKEEERWVHLYCICCNTSSSPSLVDILFFLLVDILFLPIDKNTLIFLGLVVLFLLFSFHFSCISSSLCGAFFISLFPAYQPKLSYKKVLFVDFRRNLFFWNLDIGWRSYELFSLLCIFCLFYVFFLFSCIFFVWKMPRTSYPFNFIRLLNLEPFILCFILIHLSIQCICHGIFLLAKFDFAIIKEQHFVAINKVKSIHVAMLETKDIDEF